MALQGTIKDFGLGDILQLIGIQRKTGVLTMESAEDTVTVKFLDGQVVGADTRSRNLEDLLGSVLVRTGRITEAQLQEALKVQRSTLQRVGYILATTGSISEEDLREALRIQVLQIVYRLFRWRDGKYHFTPTDHVDYDVDHFTPVSAETILMEGARMIDEWPILERRIKSPRMVFRKTAAGSALDAPVASLVDADVDFGFDRAAGSAAPEADGVQVSPEELEVLHMVDGRGTVQDLVDRSPLGEFDVYRLMYELLNRNLIEEVRVAVAPGAVQAEERRRAVLAGALAVPVLLLAAAGLVASPWSPLAPWRSAGVGAETDLLKTYASQARLERIENALQVFYYDLGSIPSDLGALVRARYLAAGDLLDPWGRPYAFQAGSGGYELRGADARGEPSEDLTVRRAYSANQRLLLGASR